MNDSELTQTAPPLQTAIARPPELLGLHPGELLARGLHTRPPSSGPWQPPSIEHVAWMLPQYRIEALLGRGGMGAVYRGVQEALGRPVAIKILPPDMSESEEFVARFQREARMLAKLQHPGIITVYGFGKTSDDYLYFVMEFVDGTDLSQLLRKPCFYPEQAFDLFGQVCAALEYAHAQSVIHRDIKPQNILVTRDGRVKVADFGLARPMDEDHAALTLSGTMMGTPAYMAPEQREGHPDRRSDIYALGVLLYEMLAGVRPEGIFTPLSARVPVNPRLDQVISKALQHDPERRYQHVGDLSRAVERHRTDAAAPDAARARSVVARWTVAVGCVGAVIVLAMAGLGRKAAPVSQAPVQTPVPATRYKASEEFAKYAMRLRESALAEPTGRGTSAPAVSSTSASALHAATMAAPFVNRLGMKFVPLPGTGVLVCMHETRRGDYAAFAAETGGLDESWKSIRWHDVPVSAGDDHPVVNVSWTDANRFCAWLSKKEGFTYRLPTDREWSTAVGLGDEPAGTPSELDRKIRDLFPWGTAWPPPAGAGNFADMTTHAAYARGFIDGYTDGHATTAPVMSFRPNSLGIHDLAGNVLEWCADWFDQAKTKRTMRGGAWLGYGASFLFSSCRYGSDPDGHYHERGFRCVVETPPAGKTAP